jgi:hypothetical protein
MGVGYSVVSAGSSVLATQAAGKAVLRTISGSKYVIVEKFNNGLFLLCHKLTNCGKQPI